jgi:hypothetical protein
MQHTAHRVLLLALVLMLLPTCAATIANDHIVAPLTGATTWRISPTDSIQVFAVDDKGGLIKSPMVITLTTPEGEHHSLPMNSVQFTGVDTRVRVTLTAVHFASQTVLIDPGYALVFRLQRVSRATTFNPFSQPRMGQGAFVHVRHP